jgi:hypothetical protein
MIMDDGPLNPENWPIIGGGRPHQEYLNQYREEHPLPEDGGDNVTFQTAPGERHQQNYMSLFDSLGGVDESYENGAGYLTRALASLSKPELESYGVDVSSLDDWNPELIGTGLDLLANEAVDDGTLHWENLTSKYMTGSQYKLYQQAGMGGRPTDEIDDNAVYNKIEEWQDYNFIPYIKDDNQFEFWKLTQIPDTTSKLFNIFSNIREDNTDAKINYNGEKLSRDEFLDNVDGYFSSVNDSIQSGSVAILSPTDPNADPETMVPVTVIWTIPGMDIEIPSNEQPISIRNSDGSITVYWPGYENLAVDYENDEDLQQNLPTWNTYRSDEGEPVHYYMDVPVLSYVDSTSGKEVRMTYDEAERLTSSLANGTADMDWGFLNIAKDANNRKDFTHMLTSMDFSDIVPNMVDLLLGSAPLFNPYTGWTMGLSNAVGAAQGLDPRLWDQKTNSYRALSEDMTGDKYASNIALNALLPLTERLAGNLGGKSTKLYELLQNWLGKIGAPKMVRYGTDWAAEGVEEDIGAFWEDLQVNGLTDLFCDPIYKTDENGNTLMEFNPRTMSMEPVIDYDETGHEKRDPNTPMWKRFQNYQDQMLENFLAGSALGGAMGIGPAIADSQKYGSGSQESRALRILENAAGVPHYREAKNENHSVHIGPESIGTYGEKR